MKRYKVNLKGQERKYTVSENFDIDSDDHSEPESFITCARTPKKSEKREPKGIEELIEIRNPNRSNNASLTFESTYTSEESKKSNESRNVFDEKLTEETQADMARLALVRRQRQKDAEAREEERLKKEEQQKQKRELALQKLTKSCKKHVSKNHKKDWNQDSQK